MTGGLTGGDDADDFGGFFIAVGVNDEQEDDAFGESDGVPSWLAILRPFDEGDATRIVENQLSRMEIDAVFDEVRLVYFRIPFEAKHMYVQIGTYTSVEPRPRLSSLERRGDCRRLLRRVGEPRRHEGFCGGSAGPLNCAAGCCTIALVP